MYYLVEDDILKKKISSKIKKGLLLVSFQNYTDLGIVNNNLKFLEKILFKSMLVDFSKNKAKLVRDR